MFHGPARAGRNQFEMKKEKRQPGRKPKPEGEKVIRINICLSERAAEWLRSKPNASAWIEAKISESAVAEADTTQPPTDESGHTIFL